MDKVNKRQLARYRRRLICTLVMTIALLALLIMLVTTSCTREEPSVSEETIQANIDALEETAHVISADEIDWEEIIIQAAVEGNTYIGTSTEEQMISYGLDNGLRYFDLIDLAKIMQEEDGVGWPDMMIMALGEVVLNRVASPEFPNSVMEVLHQTNPTQYAPVQAASWDQVQPEERYLRLAARLMKGERVLNDPRIVYQALFEQGGGEVMTYTDWSLHTKTYFCLTDNPELYG